VDGALKCHKAISSAVRGNTVDRSNTTTNDEDDADAADDESMDTADPQDPLAAFSEFLKNNPTLLESHIQSIQAVIASANARN